MERHWSYLKDVLPAGARCVSEEWLELLTNLCFLRFNYTHFNKGWLPKWCNRDSLLAQRIDGLASCLRALQDEDPGLFDHLFKSFD